MSTKTWLDSIPGFDKVMNYEPIFWINDQYKGVDFANQTTDFSYADMVDARERLKRFAPYFNKYFPETREREGIIESDITPIPAFKS